MTQKNALYCGNINFFLLHVIFIISCVFPHLNVLYGKSWLTVLLMEDRTRFKLFYWLIFYLAGHVGLFNSMTITERLNGCTTKMVQRVPKLIHVKLYNLIMIMTCTSKVGPFSMDVHIYTG